MFLGKKAIYEKVSYFSLLVVMCMSLISNLGSNRREQTYILKTTCLFTLWEIDDGHVCNSFYIQLSQAYWSEKL